MKYKRKNITDKKGINRSRTFIKKKKKSNLYGFISENNFNIRNYPPKIRKSLIIEVSINKNGTKIYHVKRKKKSNKRLSKKDFHDLKTDKYRKRRNQDVEGSFDFLKPKNPARHIRKNKLNPNNPIAIKSGFETNRKRH